MHYAVLRCFGKQEQWYHFWRRGTELRVSCNVLRRYWARSDREFAFVITHATNADGALRAQGDCVAGGLQPEADMMNSEMSVNTPRRQF